MNYKQRASQFLTKHGLRERDESVPQARAKPQQREYVEQKAVVQWAQYRSEFVPALRLLHAIPNGGSRSKRQDPRTGRWYSPEANRFKAMGVVAGIPDLHLPVARKGYHSLYIEVKAAGGKVSDDQTEMIRLLEAEGNLCKVCVGRGEAIETLIDYLDIPSRYR